MKEIYIQYIAGLLQVRDWQVENCAELIAEGCTIPFISRYRKERTGGLDDVSVAEVKHWCEVFGEMEKRKATILTTIGEAGKLTDELRGKIENSVSSSELEDLYLPYRPKRKTRATVAVANGLEPLADALWNGKTARPDLEAAKYVGDKVSSVEDALAGARDIIAERLSETAVIRENLQELAYQFYLRDEIASDQMLDAADFGDTAKMKRMILEHRQYKAQVAQQQAAMGMAPTGMTPGVQERDNGSSRLNDGQNDAVPSVVGSPGTSS